MTGQRIHKVSSVVRQVVAAELAQHPTGANLAVTAVDVAPDLRSCIVWIGVIAPASGVTEQQLFDQATEESAGLRKRMQQGVAAQLTTKFVPRLQLRYDAGGVHAERIGRLIDSL